MKIETDVFDIDVARKIYTNPGYAAAYFEALMSHPLPIQLALLRRFLGVTQNQLAMRLKLKQTHISRLEKVDSDHLLSLYQRAAEMLGARLAIVPDHSLTASSMVTEPHSPYRIKRKKAKYENLTPEQRIEEVEKLRQQHYRRLGYKGTPRLVRVIRIVKRRKDSKKR